MGSALSMTLADGQAEALERARARLVTAAIDTMLMSMLWALATWTFAADPRTTGIIIALAYYTVATGWLGRSPASQLLETRRRRMARKTVAVVQDAETLFDKIDSIANVPETPDRVMRDALS
jgi:hypothetical protein